MLDLNTYHNTLKEHNRKRQQSRAFFNIGIIGLTALVILILIFL